MSHRYPIYRCCWFPAARSLLCLLAVASCCGVSASLAAAPTGGQGHQSDVSPGMRAVGLFSLVAQLRQEEKIPGTPGTATLLDGREILARLVGLTDQGEWLFSQAGQRITVAKDQLMMWGGYRDRSLKPWVLLTDGSLLVAELLSIDRENVVVVGPLWSETRVPRQQVRAIVFRPAIEERARDRLFYRALTEERGEDQLLLENGDELKGTMPDELKPEPGAFHPERIRWPVSGTAQPIDMPLDRVSALLMATGVMATGLMGTGQNGAAVPGDAVWVGLIDGSRVLASRLTRAGKSLEFELACGARLVTDAGSVPAGEPYDAVTMLQPLVAAITFLSDLEPLGYKHIPFLSVTWPYSRDRSVSGGQLRFDGNVYRKGLGMHSSSRLAYKLGGQYRSMQAELALDQRAGREGSVVYRVYLQDAAGQWTKNYDSGVVRGGQDPVSMRVDVTGAEAAALIVDFADRADQWDHANWLNARLVR